MYGSLGGISLNSRSTVSSEVRPWPDQHSLCLKQQRIYDWIKNELDLPMFAEIFKGAIVNSHQEMPGYGIFVAHAGREIINGLARTYRGDTRIQVQYKNYFDKISPRWNEQWGAPMGVSESSEPEYHEIPYDICKMLKSLIDEHNEGLARNAETNEIFFSTFLDYEDRKEIPRNFIEKWKAAKAGFVKYAHVNISTGSPQMENEVSSHFKTLETFLSIAANSRQRQRVIEINEILRQANQ